LSTTFLY